MPTKEEIAEKYMELRKLDAKVLMYKDVCEILGKYEKKLDRLHNDAKNTYERLHKKDPKSKASFEALKRENTLSYQDNASMELRIELLERLTALLEQENKLGSEVESMFKEFENDGDSISSNSEKKE